MKIKKILIIVLAIFILIPFATKAADQGSRYVAKGEIITGNLISSGKTITIDGNISGDLIAIAKNININGQVDGDVLAIASQNININGEIGGNVRVIAPTVNINNSVARNINILAHNVILGKQAKIFWDALICSSHAEIRGTINGSLNGHIKQLLLTGVINNNVDIAVNNSEKSLIIGPGAIIKGQLKYKSSYPAQISNQAQLNSTPIYQKINKHNFLIIIWSLLWLFKLLSALIVGLVLVLVFKKTINRLNQKTLKYPNKTLIPGIIIMSVFPIISILLILTIIGVPAAFIIIVLWAILIYLSKILVAIMLGQLIITKINKKSHGSLLWSLFIGTIILFLLFSIPFIGWIIMLLSVWFGLGAMYLYVFYKS